MNSEKELLVHVKKLCKRLNVLCYKFSSPAKRGVPDLILVSERGACVFVELKSPNKKGRLSALQIHEIDKLKSHKAQVYVIDSPHDATDLIESLGTLK